MVERLRVIVSRVLEAEPKGVPYALDQSCTSHRPQPGFRFLLILSFAPLKGDAGNPVVSERGDGDADLPARLTVEIDKQEYFNRRAEAIAMKRGRFDDPAGQMRARAVEMLNLQEANARQRLAPDSIGDSWISVESCTARPNSAAAHSG